MIFVTAIPFLLLYSFFMTCPRCEEGILKKVEFVPNGQIAFLCDTCQTLWLDNERITQSSGQPLHSFVPEDGYEYYIDIFDEKDQEHQPIIGKIVP